MSQEAVERLLGRLITDEQFRRLCANSLEVASFQEGYILTPLELQLLSKLKQPSVTELCNSLDPGLCRAGGGPPSKLSGDAGN